MHVSSTHRFVYIGIPRTGSKSMYQWLSENFQSESVGGHHEWRVPEEFKDYLVFTTVRNPYERVVSGWFFEPVIKTGNEPPRPKTLAEGMQRTIAKRKTEPEGHHISQKDFVRKSGASLVRFFERIPECLAELSFVERGNIPPFPHNNAGGFRPPEGDFFDHFTMEDEKLVWEYSREDFETFGYRRHETGLPDGSNHCLHLTTDRAAAS